MEARQPTFRELLKDLLTLTADELDHPAIVLEPYDEPASFPVFLFRADEDLPDKSGGVIRTGQPYLA